MRDWRNNLKAFDKVIYINKWCSDTVRTISKTTKTLVIFDGIRINRNSSKIREATPISIEEIEIELDKFELIDELFTIVNGDPNKLTIKNLTDAIKILST